MITAETETGYLAMHIRHLRYTPDMDALEIWTASTCIKKRIKEIVEVIIQYGNCARFRLFY